MAISPIEWELLEAGEAMDESIAVTQRALMDSEHGEEDDEYLIAKQFETTCRRRFKLAYRAAMNERAGLVSA